METVREPLLVLDASRKILSANRSFYTTFKVTPADTLRHTIYELGNGQWEIPQLRTLLEGMLSEKESFEDFEVVHDFKDIGRKIMLLNARRIYRKTMGTQTILLAIEDITERRELESALKESEELYRRVYETASDGILLLEKSEGKIARVNPAFGELSGYSTEETIGKKLQDVGVLPDLGDFQRMLRVLEESGIIHYKDAPVRTRAGRDIDTDIYLVDKARLVQCNVRNITDRKQAEAAIKDSEQRYRTLAEATQDMIFVINQDDCVEYVNQIGIRQFGYLSEDKIIGSPRAQLFPPEIAERQGIGIRRVFQTGEPLNIEGVTVFPDHEVWLNTWLVPLKDDAGMVKSVLGVARDITERKRAEEALKKSELMFRTMSLTDELTALYNRRGFIALSEQQVKIAKRTKKDLLLFFVDLDDMKKINDTLGHQEGDTALAEIATILKEVFRESDVIGRIGGDEFAVLAIDTTDETREVLITKRVSPRLCRGTPGV